MLLLVVKYGSPFARARCKQTQVCRRITPHSGQFIAGRGKETIRELLSALALLAERAGSQW